MKRIRDVEKAHDLLEQAKETMEEWLMINNLHTKRMKRKMSECVKRIDRLTTLIREEDE